jgi:V8-like Glu-specific endopeptidase
VPSKDPLTRLQAQRRWRRDAIETFAFPQPPRAKRHALVRPQPGQQSGGEERKLLSVPVLPEVGDITVAPELILPPRRLRAAGRDVDPLIVYPPDGRHVFRDTSWPWRVCGRVTTNTGQGAGALVGPRHLLTASHVVGWTASDAGWLLFQPDYYEGDVFASSYAERTLYYEENSPQSMGEYAVAEDYVVCILKERLGEDLGGWFGTVEYDEDWDGENAWSHVGYPDDIGGGVRPAWELWFGILNMWHPGYFESGHGLDILTHASMNKGDSGGPVFGWWSDGGPSGSEPAGPYIVGVVSGQGELSAVVTNYSSSDRTGNWVAGGAELPELVNQAREEYP